MSIQDPTVTLFSDKSWSKIKVLNNICADMSLSYHDICFEIDFALMLVRNDTGKPNPTSEKEIFSERIGEDLLSDIIDKYFSDLFDAQMLFVSRLLDAARKIGKIAMITFNFSEYFEKVFVRMLKKLYKFVTTETLQRRYANDPDKFEYHIDKHNRFRNGEFDDFSVLNRSLRNKNDYQERKLKQRINEVEIMVKSAIDNPIFWQEVDKKSQPPPLSSTASTAVNDSLNNHVCLTPQQQPAVTSGANYETSSFSTSHSAHKTHDSTNGLQVQRRENNHPPSPYITRAELIAKIVRTTYVAKPSKAPTLKTPTPKKQNSALSTNEATPSKAPTPKKPTPKKQNSALSTVKQVSVVPQSSPSTVLPPSTPETKAADTRLLLREKKNAAKSSTTALVGSAATIASNSSTDNHARNISRRFEVSALRKRKSACLSPADGANTYCRPLISESVLSSFIVFAKECLLRRALYHTPRDYCLEACKWFESKKYISLSYALGTWIRKYDKGSSVSEVLAKVVHDNKGKLLGENESIVQRGNRHNRKAVSIPMSHEDAAYEIIVTAMDQFKGLCLIHPDSVAVTSAGVKGGELLAKDPEPSRVRAIEYISYYHHHMAGERGTAFDTSTGDGTCTLFVNTTDSLDHLILADGFYLPLYPHAFTLVRGDLVYRHCGSNTVKLLFHLDPPNYNRLNKNTVQGDDPSDQLLETPQVVVREVAEPYTFLEAIVIKPYMCEGICMAPNLELHHYSYPYCQFCLLHRFKFKFSAGVVKSGTDTKLNVNQYSCKYVGAAVPRNFEFPVEIKGSIVTREQYFRRCYRWLNGCNMVETIFIGFYYGHNRFLDYLTCRSFIGLIRQSGDYDECNVALNFDFASSRGSLVAIKPIDNEELLLYNECLNYKSKISVVVVHNKSTHDKINAKVPQKTVIKFVYTF